jgi:DNA-binding response OmpR family regulator
MLEKMMPETQTILLIDDQKTHLMILTLHLEDYHFNVLTALTGQEGLELAKRHLPALILLDISMPSMDGFSVCAQLKADPVTTAIPVIFFSALEGIDEKIKAFSLGAVDYVTKPVRQEELLARITLHINQQHLYANLVQRLNAYQARFGCLPDELTQGHEVSVRHIKQIEKARDLMLKNLRNPPSLDELALAVGMGRKKLATDFQILYGMPVFEWLRDHRLQKACTLLRDTDLSIEHISMDVGYANSANFSNAFKRRFHLSPRHYRSLYRDVAVFNHEK